MDEIMKKHDLEKNGVLSKDEFKALFLDTTDLKYAKNFDLKTGQLTPEGVKEN